MGSYHHNQQSSSHVALTAPQKPLLRRICRFFDKRAIVVVTFTYTVFAGLQWWAMKEALQLTAESLDLTRQAMRAELDVSGIALIGGLAPSTTNTVMVGIKNLGSTKATRVGADWMSWVCDGPPSESCLSQCHFVRAVNPLIGSGSIGRDMEVSFHISSPVRTPVEADAIKIGRKTLYVCGRVRYRDVFDQHHDVTPCAHYRPDREQFMRCSGIGREYY
jgi:hypothetical protein